MNGTEGRPEQHSTGDVTEQRDPLALELSRTWTAETYARSVSGYARVKGLYHGEDYEKLGEYMMSALAPNTSNTSVDNTMTDDLAAPRLYTWGNSQGGQKLSSIVELIGCELNHRGSVLVLSGHQKAEWLNAVGAKLHLDPAFFHNHLDFKAATGRRELFASPSLPSADEGIIRLRYTTIGIRGNVQPGDVRALRDRGSTAMRRYMQSLSTARGLKQGDSMVRRYHVHTHEYFSVEQYITIGVHKADQSWRAVAWVDSGHDLVTHGPDGPWRDSLKFGTSSSFYFLPTILRTPRVALRWHRPSTRPPTSSSPSSSIHSVHSLVHLCGNLGDSLDPEIMAEDPFYAVGELLQFSAFNMCQFLNLIESVITSETAVGTIKRNKFDISNLNYHRQILDDLIRTLLDNIRSIEQRGGRNWPAASQSRHREKAGKARSSLLIDYQELLRRSRTLAKRCHDEMRIILNQASIAEAQRSLHSAKRVEQLSLFGALFIPMTFTASFLGMNLQVFGQGSVPLWVWFTITVPLLIATLGVLKFM